MSHADLVALSPVAVLGLTVVASLLITAWRRGTGVVPLLSLGGLAAAGVLLAVVVARGDRAVTGLLAVDGLALLYGGLILAATVAVALLAHRWLELPAAGRGGRDARNRREEFYMLLVLAALGALVLTQATHFASLLLGLELLSVALYALIAFPVTVSRSVEAGVKYLIPAGTASAMLLLGMALVYAGLGSLELGDLADAVRRGVLAAPAAADGAMAGHGAGLARGWVSGGLALMVAAFAFKLALAPFHMWAPDVYQGAPAPVSAFIATASKGAVFAVLLRIVLAIGDGGASGEGLPGGLVLVLGLLAAASMVTGNLLALEQRNLKRLLAASSIAHLGYLLVALLAGAGAGARAATFYLAAYFPTMIAAFGVLTVLGGRGREAESIEAVRGLFWRRPWLSAILTCCLLSLAGIPLTAGFVAKFFVLASGVGASLWLLALLLVAMSAVSLFYYLRVIVAMLADVDGGADADAAAGRADQATGRREPAPRLRWTTGLVLTVLPVVIVWLGVNPGTLEEMIATLLAR
ncbi:MAG: NADH-quinone oxidoreductase subunit N [Candidatus Eiseniibacteriota bacterium]|jgi:NADH-quinone oxidoreductase subunit N